MDDRELAAYRDAYRHLLKENAEPPPSEDELAALVTGELDPDARDQVVRQMLGSQEAIEKHKILQEVHRQAEQRQPSQRIWPRVAGVAAALVLAFSVWQFAPPEPQDPAQRGARPENGGQAGGVPGGNAALDVAPGVYQWKAEPGARRYRLQVFDDAARRLWQSDWTAATQIPAPTDDELSLSNGERYFWIVEIDGSAERQSLGPYWFRIKQ